MDEDSPKIVRPPLTPFENRVKKGKISISKFRKRNVTHTPCKIKITALTNQEYESRTQRIKNEWGSLSNFCSAMIWYFTQGFVDAKTITGIRIAWETRLLDGPLQELTEEQITRALQEKKFWEKLQKVRTDKNEENLEIEINEAEMQQIKEKGIFAEDDEKMDEIPIVEPVDFESLRDFIFKRNKI
jgi:hypothetical protein